MQCFQVDQSQLLVSMSLRRAVTFLERCMSDYGIGHAPTQRICIRYDIDSMQKHRSSFSCTAVGFST